MAKLKRPSNQIRPERPRDLPEYEALKSEMISETASIITDYVRHWVGAVNLRTPEPGQGIFLNFDRVATTQTYQELAWFDLYAELERDTHVKAVLDSAKLNVAGMKWDVSAHMNPGEKKPSARNQAIADAAKHALENTGYLPQHLFNLMGALGMGFAVSEIIWEITDEGILPKTLINRPPRRFQFDAVDRSLKLRNINNVYYGDPLPAKKFIVHRCASQWENPFGDALDQSLYWMWLFKRTVLKYWMQHLQVGSSSIPIVQHPASANKQLKAEALSIAEMIRNGAYGRIPDNFTILWAEAKNAIANAETYERFIRTMNDEMAKCINGQTLTAEASSSVGSGSRALGAIHQVTQNQRDVFRAEGLSATINSTIVKWYVDFNFSGVEGYPKFRFDQEEAEDLSKESTIVKNLSDAGYDFSDEELSETFNYTITKKAPLKLAPATDPNKLPTDPNNPEPTDPTEMSEDMTHKNMGKFLVSFAESLEKDEKESEKRTARIEKALVELAERQEKKEIVEAAILKIASRDPVINFTPPAVHVSSPTVNVPEFKQTQQDIHVHVPEQKPPVVNVTMQESDKELVIERDSMGWLKKAMLKATGKK